MNLKIFADKIEVQALEQVYSLLQQDAFKDCKVRIMPDVHAGKGCVIGFTADLGDKVIPNVVGVDLGCGMLACKFPKGTFDLESLDYFIRECVPSGFNVYQKPVADFPELLELRCLSQIKNLERVKCSIGTLGGGNHFLEIDVDSQGNEYLIVHSGSRNLGLQVATIYQDIAVQKLQKNEKLSIQIKNLVSSLKELGRGSDIQIEIQKLKENAVDIPREFAYLEGQDRKDYLHDMAICQNYAAVNRRVMIERILSAFEIEMGENFETVHNYIDLDSNIVRKGAIDASLGKKVLIPLNMRDGCIIAIGKGNEDWNCSAPHGAGRLMSRTKAKEAYSLQEFTKSMEGIYSTSIDQSTIDECAMAYKPKEEILRRIGDTVEVVEVITPIWNFKASDMRK